LKLPKLGWIRFHKSQEITGKLVNVTELLSTSAAWLGLCETIYFYLTISLDLGLKSYLVDSNNDEVANQNIIILRKYVKI